MKTTKTSAIEDLEAKGRAARAASRRMAYLSTEVKNRALHNIADSLISHKATILAANRIDYKEAKDTGMNAAMLDRLMLNASRVEGMSNDVREVAALPDPVGEVFDMRTMPNGLLIGKKRVPLGVIGAIYESRPNVTIDISVLCLKSGNAVFLRGGSETIHSNTALVKLVRDAISRAGLPVDAVQFVDNTDRALVGYILKMKTIDMIVPRGGRH
jgi:glutamate-5-semialdehyde dehydrogenase